MKLFVSHIHNTFTYSVLLATMESNEDSPGDEDPDTLTPKQVAEQAKSLLPDEGTVHTAAEAESPFTSLLTPESRLRLIDSLIRANGEPLAVSRLCDMAGVSTASFTRHEEALLSTGIMIEVDKVGNARRFALNEEHPTAQVLQMFGNILAFGKTDITLDDQFITDK